MRTCFNSQIRNPKSEISRPGFRISDFGFRISTCWLLLAALSAGMTGCRSFFRQCADKEVAEVLADKDRYPDWKIEGYHVYPDPLARFADPTNPDRPPKPPDDPAAYDLSPNPQHPCKAGVARVVGKGYLDLLAAWDAENRRALAEEEAKKGTASKAQGYDAQAEQKSKQESSTGVQVPSLLSGMEKGPRPYLINLNQSAELGLINSREFQDRREDLYLTALPVTQERFSFGAQFFAFEQAIRQYSGRESISGHVNNWQLSSTGGVAKLFSTGAVLLFNIANQTVFNLAGGAHKATTSVSNLSLQLTQPLLRGGGRAVTLEPLTQAERNLLYEIRTYARFRKEFYVSIAGGGGGSIVGGAFVPTGVIANSPFTAAQGIGNSGLQPGLIPFTAATGLAVLPGSSGRLTLFSAIPPNVSGYLGTLLQHDQIPLDHYNIDRLQFFLRLFQGIQESGDLSQLQVDQVEQQLLTAESTLLTDEQQYIDALDRFKLQLGLPEDTPLELDDGPMKPMTEQFERFEDVFKDFAAAGQEIPKIGAIDQAAKARAEFRRLATTSALVRTIRFRTEFPKRWGVWEKLSLDDIKKRRDELAEEKRKLLAKKADFEAAGKQFPAEDDQRINELTFELALADFEKALRAYEAEPWKKEKDPSLRKQQHTRMFNDVYIQFAFMLEEARNERLDQVGDQWADLPKLCVQGRDLLKAELEDAQEVVSQTTLLNRLDLMNVRAETVDAWRQVAIFANALLATLNIQYELTSSTPTSVARPLDFGGSRNQHFLTINSQLPLTRILERNNYRASLINFQRARRTMQEAEDLAVQAVRGEIRQLLVLSKNYKIQQRALKLAYVVVENSLETFQAPPGGANPPGVVPAPGTASTTGAAGGQGQAFTQALLTAQTGLYRAQLQMLSIWITYLNTRLQLYRDLELMPLDFRGVWIDDSANNCDGPDGKQPSGPGSPAPGQPLERIPEPKPDAPAQ
jgi:hypothetical protein